MILDFIFVKVLMPYSVFLVVVTRCYIMCIQLQCATHALPTQLLLQCALSCALTCSMPLRRSLSWKQLSWTLSCALSCSLWLVLRNKLQVEFYNNGNSCSFCRFYLIFLPLNSMMDLRWSVLWYHMVFLFLFHLGWLVSLFV